MSDIFPPLVFAENSRRMKISGKENFNPPESDVRRQYARISCRHCFRHPLQGSPRYHCALSKAIFRVRCSKPLVHAFEWTVKQPLLTHGMDGIHVVSHMQWDRCLKTLLNSTYLIMTAVT